MTIKIWHSEFKRLSTEAYVGLLNIALTLQN